MATLAQTGARISPDAGVLSEIHDPDCILAIWERQVPFRARPLLADNPGDVRFTSPLASLQEQLERSLTNSGFAETPERGELVSDIFDLARRFCAVLSLDAVEVRLEVVTTNSCRKFHADYVTARLITTYVGTGTDWLDEADVERIKAGKDPRQIRTLAPGDVGLFKGKLASENPAIHRSPPIEGTGETRLLLVLNPPASS